MVVLTSVKNRKGITYFKQENGVWTSNAKPEDVLNYWRTNPTKHLWWDDRDVVPIDRILQKRCHRKKIQYLVHFLAADTADEWINEEDITPDAIKEFSKAKPMNVLYSNLQAADRKFKADLISTRKSKRLVNHLFAGLIPKDDHGRILYLEAKTMLTTKTLCQHGLALQTKVPINFDIHVVNWMLMQRYANTQPFYGSFGQALQLNSMPLLAVFADFCSTFEGTDACRPRADLALMLQSKLLVSGSILAMTFSLRDNRRHHHTTNQSIQRFLLKLARSNGYRLTLLHQLSYFPAMLFLLYRVEFIHDD